MLLSPIMKGMHTNSVIMMKSNLLIYLRALLSIDYLTK